MTRFPAAAAASKGGSRPRSEAGARRNAIVVFLRAPLCPAGHLPLKGGDRTTATTAFILQRRRLAKVETTANLPP